MLVLTRRPGETIRIITPEEQHILIHINGIEQDEGRDPRVKIGVDAPRDVIIYREEVY